MQLEVENRGGARDHQIYYKYSPLSIQQRKRELTELSTSSCIFFSSSFSAEESLVILSSRKQKKKPLSADARHLAPLNSQLWTIFPSINKNAWSCPDCKRSQWGDWLESRTPVHVISMSLTDYGKQIPHHHFSLFSVQQWVSSFQQKSFTNKGIVCCMSLHGWGALKATTKQNCTLLKFQSK